MASWNFDRGVSRWSHQQSRSAHYDRGVLAGVSACALLLIIGVFLGGSSNPLASPVSLFIVLGGTLGATLIHFSLQDLQNAYYEFLGILRIRQFDSRSRIHYLISLAQKVRKEGLLILEEAAKSASDPFLKSALDLAVDSADPEELRRTLEIERLSAHARAARPIELIETMGTYAPALGLIGTLVGLIHMLGALDDPSTVGPAMGVALITTLYGAVLANMLFLPTAGKLRIRAEEEALLKSITIEGIVCLTKQENPIVVEQKLQTYVPRKIAV